jgi:hypothetical protein
MLDRLIVSARYDLGLPIALAFLVGFSVLFLFVLSSLFSVFLLWEIARGVVEGWRWRKVREGKEGTEFVIRSMVVVRPSPMKGILSPVGSRVILIDFAPISSFLASNLQFKHSLIQGLR